MRRLKSFSREKYDLTENEANLVKYFVDPASPTRGNKKQSSIRAYPKCKNPMDAYKAGRLAMNRPRVQKTLKALLEETDIKQYIQEGLAMKLSHRQKKEDIDRTWLDAATLAGKLTKDLGGEEHTVHVTPPNLREELRTIVVEMEAKKQEALARRTQMALEAPKSGAEPEGYVEQDEQPIMTESEPPTVVG